MEPTSLPQFKDVPWRWIAYGASGIVVAAVAFGFLHEVELKQDVQCEIVSPSDVKVQGLSGLVSSVYVHAGERVTPGMPLFRVQRDLSLASDGRQRAAFDEQMRDEQIRATDAQYQQRKAQLEAQLGASNATIGNRRAEVVALDEQIAQSRQLVGEAEHKLNRLQSVSDYVTADRIEQASADTHQMKISVAQGVARRQQLNGEIATLHSTQGNLTAQLKENDARHARDIQDIRMRFEQSRQDSTISAPKPGVVMFSSLVPGRSLEPADVALVISTEDKSALRAALRIPSRRRGFVQMGQIVRLKFDAFPYVKFGTYEARIDAISQTTVQSPMSLPPVTPTSPKDTGDGDFMAWATLRGRTFDYGNQHFDILPGMRATASIVVERRTIAEWVLEPLFRTMRG
ncbi:HlyD family efflux transporter periplasmic adaptor subunit [Paraburkholderia sp. 22B1P]|uniref:HlyD family efflux transporter periplasmic adaptor subunit n=1 Tax=Paraburkholderia sp. 22B1P TaxID=3080498 RepID=UPI003093CADA|nr:HlyD family efflux transporter periplasmic adaptor subunit [Paraburkholderia sp. 22B1P]